ncbi:hypothetical protein BLNAU_15780 [Blattamonas nauphoetae]|uniref:Rhodanese domain-containing protein n=1 Tax=Blattamonas nauphoetae TaxID=2049346 RepID=A0ABQ9XEN3_9EUKA|nr:hypothetical protein BLNAU_15780 [Blattamonas nauphoetae]
MKEDSSSIIIVDVRDTDYTSGCIPNSRHIPFDSFKTRAPFLIENISQMSKPPKRIIFHCHKSQSRGPRAAKMFQSLVAGQISGIQTCILYGGWSAWRDTFKDEPDLIEPITPS